MIAESRSKASRKLPTVEALLPGRPVYLRFIHQEQERVELLKCVRFDVAELTATLEWLPELTGHLPMELPKGLAATCYYLRSDMLCATSGEITRLDPTQPALLSLAVSETTSAYTLRRHERYCVLARLRLGEPEDGSYFYYNDEPLPLNISLGGFGLRMKHLGWQLEDRVRFVLEAVFAEQNEISEELPVLNLQGSVVLRNRIPFEDDPEHEYFGFEFTDLTRYQHAELGLWLAAGNVNQRDEDEQPAVGSLGS